MNRDHYNPLQIREIFHLEFLRWFAKKTRMQNYALKGGANLRFFFKSVRYSEDMDIDISGIGVNSLKDIVIELLKSTPFREGLKPFGIKEIVPPNMIKARQTKTTQRFKIHLLTFSEEDLFTKIEFSRRGFTGMVITESLCESILRFYKLPPLLVPHYDICSAAAQKIEAISQRSIIQARDIFDLYILTTQLEAEDYQHLIKLTDKGILSKAYKHIFEVEFAQFKDTVVSYLSVADQGVYGNISAWEEIRLKTAQFVESLNKKYA